VPIYTERTIGKPKHLIWINALPCNVSLYKPAYTSIGGWHATLDQPLANRVFASLRTPQRFLTAVTANKKPTETTGLDRLIVAHNRINQSRCGQTWSRRVSRRGQGT
jgi:hypothetical protein